MKRVGKQEFSPRWCKGRVSDHFVELFLVLLTREDEAAAVAMRHGSHRATENAQLLAET